MDTGAGLSLIGENFTLTAGPPLMIQAKVVRLPSAGNSPFKVTEMVTTELRIEQLRKEVGFLVLQEPAINVILGTAFIGIYTKRIRSKTRSITLNISSLVAVADESRCDYIMTISVDHGTETDRNPADEKSCVVAEITELSSMSKTLG